MKLKRRKVLSVERHGHTFTMELECHHNVTKRDSGRKTAPNKTGCAKCEMVLDRFITICDGNWTNAMKLRTTKENLRFLEKEGHVKSSAVHHGVQIYWALAGAALK